MMLLKKFPFFIIFSLRIPSFLNFKFSRTSICFFLNSYVSVYILFKNNSRKPYAIKNLRVSLKTTTCWSESSLISVFNKNDISAFRYFISRLTNPPYPINFPLLSSIANSFSVSLLLILSQYFF